LLFRLYLNSLGLGDMEVQIIWLLMRWNFNNIRNLRSFTYQHGLERLFGFSEPILYFLYFLISTYTLPPWLIWNLLFFSIIKGILSVVWKVIL